MAIKGLALIEERDRRKKKKEKELVQLKSPEKKETTTVKKTVNNKGTTYVDRSTISKKPTTQNTTQNRVVTNKDRLSSNSTFGGINTDIRTVKTQNKPKQVYTADIYERDGNYYYKDGKKEKEIDRSFVEDAIKNKRTGVIGRYDSKGTLRTTDEKGNVKEQSLLNKAGYLGRTAKTRAKKGTIAIADAALQEAQNDLQKGENLKTTGDRIAKFASAIFNSNPEQGMRTAISKAMANSREIWKDKDKNALQKYVGTVLEGSQAISTGSTQGLKDITELAGSLDKNLDEKVAKAQQKLDAPVNKELEQLEQEKYNYGKGMRRAADIVGTTANMAPGIATSIITRNPELGILPMAVSAKGQTTERALQQGADLDTAVKMGSASGLVEAGTEQLSGLGLGIFGKGTLDDVVSNTINSKIRNKGINFLAKQGFGLTGEVGEEVISDLAGLMIDRGTIDPNAKYTFEDFLETAKNTFGSTVLTNLLTGGYGGGAYKNNIADMQNFQTKQSQQAEVIEQVNNGTIDKSEANQKFEQIENGTYEQNKNLDQIATQQRDAIVQAVQTGQLSQAEATQEMEALSNTLASERERINAAQNQVQTQAQGNETTQPNAITQETQNASQNEQRSTQESTFNNETKDKNVKIVDNKPITTNKESYNSKPKEGTIRLYTNTSAENIDSILKNGLDVSKAKQNEYEGNMTWFETRPDLKGYGGTTIAVDVPLNSNMDKVNDTQYTVYDNISPENITFIDRPVMNNYRTSDIEELLNKYGEEKTTKVFDRALENGKAFITKDEFNNIIKSINANNNVETNQNENRINDHTLEYNGYYIMSPKPNVGYNYKSLEDAPSFQIYDANNDDITHNVANWINSIDEAKQYIDDLTDAGIMKDRTIKQSESKNNQQENTQKKKFNNELADFINSETDSNKAEMSDFFEHRTTDYDKNQGRSADGTTTVFRFKKGNNEAKLTITENENEIWIDELYIKNQKQGYGKEIVDAIKKYAYEKEKEIRTFKEVGSARKFWDKMFGEETDTGGFSHRYIKHKPEYWQKRIEDTQEQIERFSKWKENALEQGKEDLANNHQEGIDWAKKRLEEYKTEYEKSKQEKSKNEEKPKNIGFHYGDLGKGKDTNYFSMTSSNRSTGHLGTGTYFVGSEESNVGTKKDRGNPKTINLDAYDNLFVPKNKSSMDKLYDVLKGVDNNKLDAFGLLDLDKVLGKSDEEIQRAINKVEEYRKEADKADFTEQLNMDSPATVFMKELGYNGIDTRGISEYDNGEFGSVIYDLKNKSENIPTTKSENVISEEVKAQNQNKETQQETTETQQQENKGPEILDTMPVEKTTTMKSLKKGINKFRQEITDAFAPIYDLAYKKTGNKNLYYKADRILSSDARAQVDLDANQVDLNGKPYKNFTDEQGNKVAMGFETAFDLYKDIPVKAKNEFLVHSLNIDRWNQGIDQFGIPIQESEQKLEELRNKYEKIDNWSENIYQYYRNLGQKMVDNGRVSQEQMNKWWEGTPHFVHIQRQVDNQGNTGVSVKNGKVDSDNLIRKVKGGDYAILPIKETTAKYTQNASRAFAFNDFGKEYARAIGTDARGESVSADTDIDEIFGFEPEFVNSDGKGTYTMKIYEKGVPVEIPISEDVYNSLSPKTIPRVGVLAEVTNVYKDLLTNKNPFFGFLRNPIKDVGDMFLYSKHPLHKSIATYTKLFGGRTALRNKVITKDGVTAQDIVDFYRNTGNAVHSIFKNGQFESNKNGVKKSVDKVLSPIEKGNDFMESMPRITEFWNTIQKEGYTLKDGELVPQKGKNPKKTPEQVIDEASYYAADVTVNFKRGGRSSKTISQNGGIFFNPSVQGASKFTRNVTEAVGDAKSGDFQAAKRLVARAAMLGVAPAILSAVMYGDDDEYKEIQDYQKDQYYLIKNGDGKWIRIPKGRAISLVESAARRTIDTAKGDKDAFKGYGQLVKNQIAPSNPLDNNIFSPLTAAATNKSWSGNKIVSDSMAKRPKAEQFNEKTDEFSKWIGKQLNISPMKVNYVIDQYSGVLGDLILPQITPKSTTGSSNPVTNILRDNFSFDAANSNKNVGEFYDMKRKANTKAYSIKPTEKDKLKSQFMNTKSKEMYDLYSKKQEIQMDKGLSKKEKYKQALEVQKEINKFAKEATQEAENISVDKNTATVGNTQYYKKSNGDWAKESEKTKEKREDLGLSAKEYYHLKNDESYTQPNGYKKYITSGENAKRNMAIVDAFNFDTSDYLEYTYKLSKIQGNKNSKGKTIKGTRQPKVIEYINSLPISSAQKAYLYKTQYSSYRSQDKTLANEINKSNLSKEEKEQIYSYLGLGR